MPRGTKRNNVARFEGRGENVEDKEDEIPEKDGEFDEG